MAKSKKKSGTAIGAGALVALLALLGVGEFGIGDFGGGMVSEVFAPSEEAVEVEQEELSDYYAVIEVVEEVITVDGEEVAIEDLATILVNDTDQKVLVKDSQAKLGTWTEVEEILNSLNCVIETE